MAIAGWGEEDWGNFIWWGAGGRALLGYPAQNPTQIIAVRALRPYHAPVRKMQPEDRSNGGVLYIYDKGVTEYSFRVTLKLTRAEHAALKDFYDNTANGKANAIYFADPEGNEHTVRIMNDRFDFPEEGWNMFRGTLLLVVSS